MIIWKGRPLANDHPGGGASLSNTLLHPSNTSATKIFSFSKYFLLFLLYSSSHKTKAQSPMSPFHLVDLFSPRIWSSWLCNVRTKLQGQLPLVLRDFFLYFPRSALGAFVEVRYMLCQGDFSTLSSTELRSLLLMYWWRWKFNMKRMPDENYLLTSLSHARTATATSRSPSPNK